MFFYWRTGLGAEVAFYKVSMPQTCVVHSVGKGEGERINWDKGSWARGDEDGGVPRSLRGRTAARDKPGQKKRRTRSD